MLGYEATVVLRCGAEKACQIYHPLRDESCTRIYEVGDKARLEVWAYNPQEVLGDHPRILDPMRPG